jgi:hypothetical protein
VQLNLFFPFIINLVSFKLSKVKIINFLFTFYPLILFDLFLSSFYPKIYEEQNGYLIVFYFNILLFYIFFYIVIFLRVDKVLPLGKVLDLEFRFCTGRHLFREVIFKIS